MKHTSFGSRSFQGAQNHAVIMTLTQTAQLNKQNPKDALLAIITQDTKKIPSLLFGSSTATQSENTSSELHASADEQEQHTPSKYIPP